VTRKRSRTQVIVERLAIDPPWNVRINEDSLQFGCESEPAILVQIEQRLFAGPIASSEQASFGAVPDCEREHSDQTTEACGALRSIRGDHDLGIACAAKVIAARLEFGSNFLKIVNLTIKNNCYLAIIRTHWLMTERAEIDDG
jgi:hypothetical protein